MFVRAARAPTARRLLLAAMLVAASGVGSAAAWELAPGDPWPDLAPGDEVRLAPGRYDGPWEIAVPDVTVRAAGATLTGPRDGSALILSAAGIAVEGLTVRDAGSVADLYAPDAAVWAVDCHGCVLRDLDTAGTPAGLRIEASRDLRVTDARLRGGPDGPGVTAYQAPGLTFEGLAVDGFLDGLYVERSDGARIDGAAVTGAERYGLHVMFSADLSVRDATVRGGGVGSAVMYGRDARIEASRFAGHQGPLAYGLLIHEMQGVEVRDVTLDGNTVGLFVVSSPDVRVTDAVVRDAGTGVLVRRTPDAATSAVEVTGSTFAGNVGDVAVDDPDASVTLRGNRYDAASRLDLDADGVSDAPYLPTSSFALLTTRLPDLSLFAFQPGVTLWERAEASVPGLRMATLHDPAPRLQAREGRAAPSRSGRLVAAVLLVAAAAAGWAARRPDDVRRAPAAGGAP
jgi:nitrous oxidase accessory protein